MFQIAIRGLRQNPYRYAATAIAIVLGVAFYVATSVMTTSFEDTLDSSIAEAFEDIDGSVRSTEVIETDFTEIRQKIPYETGEQIAAIDGVAGASAFLSGYAQVVTTDGDVVDSGGRPPQGFAWIDDAALSPYRLVDGREPLSADEIALDQDTFADGEFTIGDSVRVLPLPTEQRFTLVGVIEPNGDGGGLGAQVVAFGLDGAAEAFGTTDVDQVFVQAPDGVSVDELAATINGALSSNGVSGLEAISGDVLVDEFEDTIGQVTTIINAALQVFASIALVVGAFVIYNTFSITVAQRRRQMALLRAIGASTAQVSRSVMVESVVVGLVASVVGAVVGVGLGWLLLQALGSLNSGFDLALTIPLGAVVAGVAIGAVNTLLAAYTPARRGAKIAPIEALRESSIEQPARSRWRTLIGVATLVVGVTMSISAVSGADLTALVVGLPATVVAMVLLGPAIIRPMSTFIAVPMVRSGSITGELARENAARNPKRTSTTSLTLVIGVALVVTASVFAATVSESTRGQLDEQIVADHVVTVAPEIALLGGGLDPTITPSINELADVDAAVPFRRAPVKILDGFTQLTGTDTVQLDRVVDLNVVDGNVIGLADDEIAVSDARADADGLTVGDDVAVRFQQQSVVLQIAGIYEHDEFVGSWLADNRVVDANTNRSLDTEVLIRSNEGGGESVATAVTDVLTSNPTAGVETTASFIDTEVGQIDQLLILLYGLLAMSVLVALIGIVNTMALSIHERTRELGLLRTVGMTPRQLRRTIRYESTIIALIGTVVGLGLGLFLGWVASRAAQDTFADFTVPVTSLVVIGIVGIIAGLAAGLLPARRAGKLDVLQAISGE
jgi:putative ABC transport system permease protein